MDKLISSNLLKETITKGAIVIDENITKCDTIHDILVYLLQKFEDSIFTTIDSQPPADLPWIPVSSGILPKTGQQIFATCKQGGELNVMEIYYNSKLLIPPWRMTAWMPAEPYKED